MNERITLVSPELPPVAGGVADYVAHLAAHWPGGGLNSWYVGEGAEEAAGARPDWRVRPITDDGSGAGWPDSGVVLVHYTQYGYAGNGIPRRFTQGLQRWRAGGRDTGAARRLAVFFHETWQEGPLWRRRGLIAPAARKCALELAAAADVVATNCRKHASQLGRGVNAVVLPVPSNIPVSAEPRAGGYERMAQPRLRVVVFGLPETRLRALRAHRGFLSWLRERGGLAELVIVGAGDESGRFAVEGARIAAGISGGVLRRVASALPEEVSAELAAADLGLSGYGADEVGKSGTLAALFTHGCPVGCAGHDAGGLGLDLSMTGDGPRDWDRLLDAGARVEREARVAIYAEKELGWAAHAARLAELVASH